MRATWPGLPVLVRLAGRPVILLGDGEAADAKRRLLARAGATVVAEHPDARLAVVAIEGEGEAVAAVAALKARGLLVNAVDRPALCDFTLPAVVDRAPVLVAVMTGGVSAGLAAAVRQRLEGLLPSGLGSLAEALGGARERLRLNLPDAGERRRAIGAALAGELDPLDPDATERVGQWIEAFRHPGLQPGSMEPQATGSGRDGSRLKAGMTKVVLASPDPDDLTLRQARALALADRVYHGPAVPLAILDRARADAARIACDAPPSHTPPGRNVWVEGP